MTEFDAAAFVILFSVFVIGASVACMRPETDRDQTDQPRDAPRRRPVH